MTIPASGAVRPARRSELAVRTIAGVAMIAVAVACLWLGAAAFWLLCALCALLMMAEWSALFAVEPWRRVAAIVAVALLMLVVSPLNIASVHWDAALGGQGVLFGVWRWVALAAAGLAIVTLRWRLGAGLLYVGLPAIALVFLRGQEAGLMLALWTLAIVWATDIGAYFAGRAIGGPKLAPRISPSKTWAGLGGGVIAALVVSLGFMRLGGLPLGLAALAPLLALLAQLGDLFESWLKRRAGVKDSGRLLPGHGGALDRLDGLVPVAVTVAALVAAGAGAP